MTATLSTTKQTSAAGVFRMDYSLTASPLGQMLLAATDRGICFLHLGDCDADLEARLQVKYPSGRLNRDEKRLLNWENQLLRHLEGEQPELDLPLDVAGTSFQRRVWEELRAIPYGSTRTYREVAQAMGRPKAVRAVARACATNPVAVIVPCHRVIRSDGSLGGYAGGLHRKKELLDRERGFCHAACG